ncbi:MAG: hypothetical protein HW419_3754, partial [Deltaproteobacteria bacterium]|nr:hypothetical protein [Deltaproteobacteria bacterium]
QEAVVDEYRNIIVKEKAIGETK